MKRYSALAQILLRLALGMGFLSAVADRFGLWGHNGEPGVAWGDWAHFYAYARKLMFFLPGDIVEVLAIIATVAEFVFGLLLIIGWKTQIAAMGSGVLGLSFAVCMTLALGVKAPFDFSVFSVAAAGFLLASVRYYPLSIDRITNRVYTSGSNNAIESDTYQKGMQVVK